MEIGGRMKNRLGILFALLALMGGTAAAQDGFHHPRLASSDDTFIIIHLCG